MKYLLVVSCQLRVSPLCDGSGMGQSRMISCRSRGNWNDRGPKFQFLFRTKSFTFRFSSPLLRGPQILCLMGPRCEIHWSSTNLALLPECGDHLMAP